jgi:hypothetical protein
MNYAKIGSVSSGTMLTEDLLGAFSGVLDDCVQRNADLCDTETGRYMTIVNEARDWLERESSEETADDTGEGDLLVEELFGVLGEFAPPYTYFGAHEGDGANYGFWPSFDNLEEDAHCGEVLKVTDLSDVPDDFRGYVMHVNDHGNVSLYQANGAGQDLTKIWSCV